jgi:hypothetical protein
LVPATPGPEPGLFPGFEFAYATQAIRKGASGETVAENLNALAHETDLVAALDRLQASAPRVESVSLVVAWFGDDLRAGHCQVRPAVEVAAKATTPRSWSVNGIERGAARVVSADAEGRPIYGGTPADFAVVQAIRELKARGLRVTFYPFILMDVPAGNDLPDPYSDHAATLGQPAFPWRGRITCAPAAAMPAASTRPRLRKARSRRCSERPHPPTSQSWARASAGPVRPGTGACGG